MSNARYLIIKPNPNNTAETVVWNFRTKQWTNEVTNGCRYAGRRAGRWSGIVPSHACDAHFRSLHTVQGVNEDVQIMSEEYILKNDLSYGAGLTFY